MLQFLNLSKTDIFTPSDRSNALRFVVGAMALLATLILALGLWINQTVGEWRSETAGEITIELPAQTDDATIVNITNKLEANSAVRSARAISKSDVLAMLGPWLGDISGTSTDSFALPRLIAVKLAPDTQSQALLPFLPATALIDDHGATLGELLALSTAVQSTIVGLIILIGATTFAVVSFATQAAIQSHRDVIAIVHQIGATDRYVSAEFERHFFRAGLTGAMAGWAIGLVLAAGIAALAPGGGLQAALELDVAALSILGLVPLVLALVATLTARFAVLKKLQTQL
ncbi:MAG: cell division protein FtsX [Alphaproteobacteria bacterium]